MRSFFIGIWLFSLTFLVACSDETPSGTGKFTLIFNNKVDFAPMIFNASFAYENEAGDLFKVSGFRYYISHVVLHNATGATYEVPMKSDGSEGFFLIDQAVANSREISFENVPVADYNAVSFQIGFALSEIDTANATGALARSKGMFGGNAGYTWLHFEGALAGGATDKMPFSVAMADASGLSAIKTKVIFQSSNSGSLLKATVRGNISPIIELTVDANGLFSAPNQFKLSETPTIGIENTAELSANMSDAFGFDHLHN